MKRICLTLLLFGGLSIGMAAQEFHMPAASPSVSLNQQFSTSFIQIDYSRPGVKGRSIFGELIPYGKVWRTGANAATKITFGEPVIIDGKEVAAGSYALYTIPGKKQWEVILNTGIKNWGAAGYDAKDDVVRVAVPVKQLSKSQESMRISLEDLTNNSANLVITWADTKVELPIKADNNARIFAHLEKALEGDKPPYATAAKYYLTTNHELDKALSYAQKAINQSPKAFYLYWLEARIYEQLGQHTKALKSAKKAADMAKNNPAFAYEYQAHYEQLKAKQ